jgi:hypothetical protein
MTPESEVTLHWFFETIVNRGESVLPLSATSGVTCVSLFCRPC